MATPTTPRELRQAISLLQECLDPQLLNQLRPSTPQTVFTTWITVWMLVYQRLNHNATLGSAVGAFLDSMDRLSAAKRAQDKTLSANTGGFSRARSRLPVAVADLAADTVFQSLLPAPPPPGFDGRRVLVVDGTSLALPSRAALRAQWPACSNQHGAGPWPICHLALVHDLETGLAMRPEPGAMYGPDAVSEVALARRMLARIPANSVLMADRNFGVFDFVFYAVQAGHDVLTRLTEERFASMRRHADPVRPGVWKWRWRPTKKNRQSHPDLPADAEVTVSLHEFGGGSGPTMWVATTLDWNTDRVSAGSARRAEIETDIRHGKKTLQGEALRGCSVDMVLKELAMASIAYNLVVQVRYLAGLKGDLPPKTISFSGVWSLVLTLLLNRDDRTAEQWNEQFEFVLRKVLQRKLPNRPNRTYPRTAYSKRSKFPTKNPPKDAAN
jgi:Transposase DDE domain